MASIIQLDIPQPCHESWDNMHPSGGGRFCDSCQKQVVDFTHMTESEIALFFKKRASGSICGRFLQDQLQKDITVPKKRVPWLKYFFQFALPAFLTSIRSNAQETVKPHMEKFMVDRSEIKYGVAENVPVAPSVKIIDGIVVDEKGYPISNATINFVGFRTGILTDEKGCFKLTWPFESDVVKPVMASAVGYASNICHGTANDFYRLVLRPPSTGNVVVVTTGMVIMKKSINKTIPVISSAKADTAHKFFNVYPNPLPAGRELTIEWKQAESSYYSVQLINSIGSIVSQRELWIDADARLLNIAIPHVSVGTYFLQIINKSNLKKYSEKILIE